MAYLLDANVFIEAKNRYYGFDVCAGFWDWLLASHEEGPVLSYVVGFAHAHGHVVVTQEVPADSVRKVKIPNACVGMGVRYLNTFEMLRRERARFVLAARSGAA